MGNPQYSNPKTPEESYKVALVSKFVTWINSIEVEQEEYTALLQDIISECNARLEDEKPDETSKD